MNANDRAGSLVSRPFSNMVARLRELASSRPQDTALIAVSKDGEVRLDYAALDARVRALAATLQARFAKGDRALLLLDNDEHYVAAFLACLYAGLVAVPVFPPESIREQHLARLAGIASDCEAACVLASASILNMVGEKADLFGKALALAVDAVEVSIADGWAPHDPRDGDIAFLQYTSGSTSTPKGVMVSHGNLMANERAIEAGMSVGDGDVFVTWLPLYHDMGLIGGLLQPLHRGVPVVLMSPTYFLERPIRWLEAISHHRGTVSGGPDFAFRLCLERIKPEQVQGLDLSSWRVAFSGAEPVRHDTLAAFIDHFAKAGFSAGAVYPCYGLAEATLFVTGGRRGAGLVAQRFADDSLAQGQPRAAAEAGAMLVSCGQAASDHVVAIMDAASREPVAAGHVGEIWVSGPSVAQGYWRRQAESEATFVESGGHRWLRTGDLGFVHEGQHYIAGRIKDVIILRGQNIYPQDLERAIEAEVEAVRKGRVAAFAVSTADGEGVGVAVEVSRGLQKLVPAEALVDALSLAVSAVCREPVSVALLLNPGALPKTSSGKLQRGACRQGWREGSLDAYAVFEQGRFVRGGAVRQEAALVSAVGDDIEAWLVRCWEQLLRRHGLGPESQFFASGGNSLAAVQLASRIGDEWAIDCPIRTVFEHPRLKDLGAELRRLRSLGTPLARVQVPLLPADRRAELLPLSHAQERQWFLWQLDPTSTAYHVGLALRLGGTLNVQALRASLANLVARHESLRTLFVDQGNGLARQQILASLVPGLAVNDLRTVELDVRELQAAQLVQNLSDVPFDLTRGPLLRADLVQLQDDDHILALVMHHIVSDGASMQVLVDELCTTYQAHLNGQAPALAPLPFQYADHAIWQRDWLAAGEGERQLAYWRAQLGGEQPVLALATDHPRQSGGSMLTGQHAFAIPPALAQSLHEAAQAQGVTLSMLLLSAFQALLHRYTGQEDVRVGVPVANRHRVDTQGVIGFFVNTLVLRNAVRGRSSLAQVLAQTREAALGAQAHQDLPFDQLVDALQAERSLSHTALFQVMFNHLVEDHRALQALPGLTVAGHPMPLGAAQFELTLEVRERHDGQLTGSLLYAAELFEAPTMGRLAGHYLKVLMAMASQPQLAVGDVALLQDEESSLIDAWSRSVALAPRAASTAVVHHLFEQEVARQPHAPALLFGGTTLSYAELNQRANQLAHHLIGLGVRPETRVGIAAERSIEMVVGLLGIMKAGGAYVPLDPDHPLDRLAYVVEDSAISWLLSQRHLMGRLPQSAGVTALALDDLDLAKAPCHNPDVPLHGENLVYVIYTSGSTGRPKGAGNRHRSLVNRLAWGQQHQPLNANNTVLQKTPFGFDISFWEFFWPLTVGARLALAGPGDHRDPARLVELIQQHGVSTIHFVPSMLRAFVAHDGVEACTGLQHIICSGEALPADLQNQVLALWPGIELLNLYGPTEAAIEVTYWDCRNDGALTVPIGRPIGDVHVHVVDADLQVVPRGVAGELLLGGVGLARGYWGRPALTAERFVADPLSSDGGRLYRTGDLVRWRLDGQIDYLGRIDHQVKIRGFRIELGEVEAQLLALVGVKESVVVAQAVSSGARLVAYVSAHDGSTLDVGGLKEELSRTLPDYMVPSVIVPLAALPLNANGKVDRKALPEPGLVSEAPHEAPQGLVEEALAAVWQAVLGLAQVGRHDNFFELGGDSILSLQIVARARQVGLKLTPRQLFERQSVAALALVARALVDGDMREAQTVAGTVPLLPVQAEFFAHDMPARHHWNQAVMLSSSQDIDADVLAEALETLVRHHDALRLRFKPDEEQPGVWIQAHADHSPQGILWVRQANGESQTEAWCAEAQRSLNLGSGPLLRAVLIKMTGGGSRLLLVAHHLVIDGVSWRILLEDLKTACAQLAAHQAVVLPSKTSSYQAWSQRLQVQVPRHAAHLSHWLTLVGVPSDLPRDFSPDAFENGDTAASESHTTFTLDRMATKALLTEVPASFRTQINDVLLTALGRALGAWCGQDRLLIDLEGHGRDGAEEDLDLSRTVGWFTSLYPVLLDAGGTPIQALQRTKEHLRQVPDKGLGHGVLKHFGDAEQRAALATLPRPQVVFNYLGQFDADGGERSAWQLMPDAPTGPWQDAAAPRWHALAINGQVLGGELSLRFSHSEARHRPDTIAALVQRFEAELRGLIELCTRPGLAGATPSDFPLASIDQEALDGLPVPLQALQDLYPLSPMQQGMLFHSVLNPDGSAYLTQLRVDLAGLDVAAFQSAWRGAFQQHAVLRTGFLARMDPPLQWVAKSLELPLRLLDWRDRESGLADALDKLAGADLSEGFDLAKPPLTRMSLVRTGDDTHHFIWTSHHLLLDGWSTARLMAEVLRPQSAKATPATPGGYRDYIAWLQGVNQPAARAHWSGQLAKLAGPTLLAEAWPKPTAQEPLRAPMHERALSIDKAGTDALLALARRERVTLNTIVQAAWALLLQRCTGQATVCFGATTAGRPAELPGVEHLLGLFINTVPVVATPDAGKPLGDWLRELQATNLAGREHEHTPLSEIQRWSGQGGQALFDSILVFENYPIDAALKTDEAGAARLSALRFRDDTHYPLTVSVLTEVEGGLRVVFGHDPQAFDAATAEGIAERLGVLLQRLPGHGGAPLTTVQALLERETVQLRQWHVNAERHDSTAPVHTLIEDQAFAQPQAVALIHGDTVLTHGELNQRSNRLAHQLIALGVRPEARVGLAVERSVDMIVALLAILKAGGAYVPLDPDYPVDRLAYMVQDSGLSLVLTQSSLLASLPAQDGVRVLCLDQLTHDAGLEHDPAVPVHGHNLAYVIYTSGSTGKPKGVCVPHHALAEHAQVGIGFFGLTPGDRMLQFSTLNFDGFIEQVFPTLCAGAAIVLRGPQLWSSDTFHRELIDKRISVVDLTTAYWFLLVQDFARQGLRDYGVLRQVHAGGEAMPPEGLKAWQAAGMSHIRLLNTYGPTEATVTATVQDCAELPQPLPNPLPIGRPLAGRQLHVLDANLNLVPPGVAGELCIGGDLLARGYGQRPGLTAERFVANPFDEAGGRLYRTGDLVRWDQAGRLQYLGRLDHQVKIRGFRIELGEIEAELLRQDGVRQALVLAEPGASGLRLIAYVAGGVEGATSRAQLARSLPDYMVPSVVVVLNALPLNPNGKIDRHALPTPEAALAGHFEAPEGEVEQALAAIWAQVLGVERVGRHDSFFELGGHSLAAIQITALLAQRHGFELPVRSLFEHGGLSALAATLPAERFGQSRTHRLSEMDRLLTEFED